MSILIKKAKLPKNCWECMEMELNVAIAMHGGTCPFCERVISKDEFDAHSGRHPDCSIVEVPEPHGRLKDADAIESGIIHKLCIRDETQLLPEERAIYEKINNAPTVIEAEGKE